MLLISAFEAGFLPSKPGKCPGSILVTLLAIAHSKSVIDDDIRSNSNSAHNGHCPSSLLSILLSFPYIYNHVQALVIGFDVISLCSGTFIASSGFPISPYCLSPCCMYFLLGVHSLMFLIWVNYDLSFFHNFWSHNTAEVLVLAAGSEHIAPSDTTPPIFSFSFAKSIMSPSFSPPVTSLWTPHLQSLVSIQVFTLPVSSKLFEPPTPIFIILRLSC